MRELEIALEESGGELTEELAQAWQENEQDIKSKADNYNALIQHLNADADAIDKEIKRLQALKKVKDNSAKRVKEHLVNVMSCFGLDRLEGTYCKMSLRKTSGLDVDEEVITSPYEGVINGARMMLPDYITIDVKVSKTAIKDALKSGEEIAGCTPTSTLSLTIR